MKKLLYLFLGLLFISQHIVAQVPSSVPTDGLVGYWPFNGNANDETGNGNNGTVNGALLTTDRFDEPNSAYDFDGVDDWIKTNNPFYQSNVNHSISIWLKTNDSSLQNQTIFNTEPHTIEYFSYNYYLSSPNYLNYFLGNGGFRGWDIASNQEFNPFGSVDDFELWNNLTITLTNLTWMFYLNGELSHTFTADAPTSSITSNVYFGNADISIINDPFFGQLDDIGIWNRALTQEEITNLYNSNSSNECSTLVINTGALSTNPVTYNSTVNIYPNPANDQITIDCGNLDNVEGWNIKITNMLGQEVFSQPMNTQQYVIPLNTWTGQGMYFVKIINAQNEVVNIKKIVLQ